MAMINTIFLPAETILTVTADSLSNGQVYRVIPGAGSSELVAVAASSSQSLGPFGIGKQYAICSKAGLLTYSISNPTAGGGKILQVLQTVKTDAYAATVSDFTDITGMSLAITPTSSSSKILISTSINITSSSGSQVHINLERDGTAVALGDAAGNNVRCSFVSTNDSNGGGQQATTWSYLDSPATTSEVTYTVSARAFETIDEPVYVNRASTTNNEAVGSPVSVITAMEVEGD